MTGNLKIPVLFMALWVSACAPMPGDTQPSLEILSAGAQNSADGYAMEARLRYQFGDAVLGAMRNGVPITLSVETRVLRERDYLWPQVVLEETRLFRLDYHALSEQYVLEDLSTGLQNTYPSHLALQDAMSRGPGLRLAEAVTLPEGVLEARVRARLHIEALPAPLRLTAYFSPQWHLQSEWFIWPVRG